MGLRSSSAPRVIGAAVGAAVALSLSTPLVLQLLRQRLRDEAGGVSKQALPGIARLSELRTSVRLYSESMARHDLAHADDDLHQLRFRWTAFQAIPEENGERPFRAAAGRELARLSAAGTVPDDGVGRTVARLDALLAELVRNEAACVERRLSAIERLRDVELGLTLLIDAVAVALAAGAVVLAWRTVREYEARLAQRTSALDRFAERVAQVLVRPLAAVSMSLEGVGRFRVGRRGRRRIERCVRTLGRLRGATQEMLTFARAGGAPQPGARAPVAATVSKVLQEVNPLADAQQVSIAVERLPEGDAACTPALLSRVVAALLTHAIEDVRRASRRQVTIRSASTERWIRIAVADTGPGMDDVARRQAFEPCLRPGASGPGGLGLAITERIVARHGGRVGVRSIPGVGSCFWFELPAAA